MSLSALESVCLVEALLRAALHQETAIRSDDRSDQSDRSEAKGFDHPTMLAERWVADYTPLPVNGTVSIAYSTGVVIQFADFAELLQSLAYANAQHKPRMLKNMATCNLLKHALEVFQRFDSGTGYFTCDKLVGFVAAVFSEERLQAPTTHQVAVFFDKFAQGKPKLNTSECLCLVDAIFRAILHCDARKAGFVGQGKRRPPRYAPFSYLCVLLPASACSSPASHIIISHRRLTRRPPCRKARLHTVFAQSSVCLERFRTSQRPGRQSMNHEMQLLNSAARLGQMWGLHVGLDLS